MTREPGLLDGFIGWAAERWPYASDTATQAPRVVVVIRARFQMELAEDIWVDELSTTFPAATFRLLTGVPNDDRVLELGEVRTETPEAVSEAIRSHHDITAYEAVFTSDERTIAQYEAEEKSLYEFLRESSLPPEFPVVVENGVMEYSLTATQTQFDAFCEALDERGRQYELLALVHTDEDDTLLTERQRECLQAALNEGYFDVPRTCTLAELSDTLDVDKSTASETIRRGQARVLEEFLVNRV